MSPEKNLRNVIDRESIPDVTEVTEVTEVNPTEATEVTEVNLAVGRVFCSIAYWNSKNRSNIKLEKRYGLEKYSLPLGSNGSNGSEPCSWKSTLFYCSLEQ